MESSTLAAFHSEVVPSTWVSFCKALQTSVVVLSSLSSSLIDLVVVYQDHQDETIAHREVEISAQLVRGKFMSIPTYGEKVYNIDVNSSRWFSCCKA